MRKKLGVIDLIGAAALAKLIWFGPYDVFFGDAGLGWHLRAGQWMAQNGRVIRSDPFLFLSGGRPWVDTQWLSDVLIWAAFESAGPAVLYAAAAGLCMAPYLMCAAPLLRQFAVPLFPGVLALLLAMLAGSLQWLLRPVLFSFLFFAMVYRLLFARWHAPGGFGSLYAAPLLFALWANLHPGFPVGLGLLGAYGAGTLLRRSAAFDAAGTSRLQELLHAGAVLLLSTAATALTPYGIDLHRSIGALVGSSFFMQLNREWLPPELGAPAFWPFYLLAAAAAAGAVGRGRREGTAFEVLVCGGLAVLSLLQRRYIPFFAIATVLPAARGAARLLARFELPAARAMSEREKRASCWRYTAAAWLLLLAAAVVLGRIPFAPTPKLDIAGLYPTALVDRLAGLENRAGGRVFHSPDWGGYLIWRIWPEKSLYIDDRNLLNGEQRYRNYFAMLQAKPDGLARFAELEFEWALVPAAAPLADRLAGARQWSEIGRTVLGKDNVVLFRREASKREELGKGLPVRQPKSGLLDAAS